MIQQLIKDIRVMLLVRRLRKIRRNLEQMTDSEIGEAFESFLIKVRKSGISHKEAAERLRQLQRFAFSTTNHRVLP